MTHPPSGGSQTLRTPDAVSAHVGMPVQRRTTWASQAERLRAVATTEPGRFQIIGAVLALLVVAFGAVTILEISSRASSADDVVNRSQPLSADAAGIYRFLADADTTAASGFLAGAQEPKALHERYRKDIDKAARLLVKASGSTGPGSASSREIDTLNKLLPVYTGLIERARANNLQGLPLGGPYLRYANQKMAGEMLPAAERLYVAETGRLETDSADARQWPLLSLGAGVLVLGALAWMQRRTYRRTNRVLNHGLLAATAAASVVLLWLAVGHAVARAELRSAMVHGQASLDVLNDARISSLKMRANENLTLVARGTVRTRNGSADQYEVDYTTGMKALEAQLDEADRLADDESGNAPVIEAAEALATWQARHREARKMDDDGDYHSALEQIIGTEDSTEQSFQQVDTALGKALAHEQHEFTSAAQDGRGALRGLPTGAAALAVLGAAAVIVEVNRKLAEYR